MVNISLLTFKKGEIIAYGGFIIAKFLTWMHCTVLLL